MPSEGASKQPAKLTGIDGSSVDVSELLKPAQAERVSPPRGWLGARGQFDAGDEDHPEETMEVPKDYGVASKEQIEEMKKAPNYKCRWCVSDGPPEWSEHAKVWIHRRDKLDRVCEKPPVSPQASRSNYVPHFQTPVQVWADIDVGISDVVAYLNTIPGVRTHSSCQGSIGEGGAAPYGPYVKASWPEEALPRLQKEFNVEIEGAGHGTVRAKSPAANLEELAETAALTRIRAVMSPQASPAVTPEGASPTPTTPIGRQG